MITNFFSTMLLCTRNDICTGIQLPRICEDLLEDTNMCSVAVGIWECGQVFIIELKELEALILEEQGNIHQTYV